MKLGVCVGLPSIHNILISYKGIDIWREMLWNSSDYIYENYCLRGDMRAGICNDESLTFSSLILIKYLFHEIHLNYLLLLVTTQKN